MYKVKVVLLDENNRVLNQNAWTFPTWERALAKATEDRRKHLHDDVFESELQDNPLAFLDTAMPSAKATKTAASIVEIS